MKPARDWKDGLTDACPSANVQLIEGRSGDPSLKIGDIFLHSRYNPREEAKRFIDSTDLDANRPVLAIGLGLGYHVLELAQRGFDVAVVESDPYVAALALEGPMSGSDILLGVGDPDAIAASPAFKDFAARIPQLLMHPAACRIEPEFAVRMSALLSAAALKKQRLGIAVVGPMFGGSLPIAKYIESAFERMGHRTLFVDNSDGWEVYQRVAGTISRRHVAGQLEKILVNFLCEWSYARVTEFQPDICLVMAQAPVSDGFPARLAKHGIVTAFWYVENWRHLPYWRDIAPLYDVFFHIQPGEFERRLDEAGCRRHAFVQTACDPEVHKPVQLTSDEQKEFGCDISFAGAGYNNRNEMFSGLTDYDFKLWGVDWVHRELQRFVRRPNERFTPELFARMVAGTKINLNLHSSTTKSGVDPDCDAINPRVFEIAACGGFQLCDPCKGLNAYFDFETELPVYRDLAELRDRIDYYLAHPDERMRIAENARKRVLSDHTYEKRAEQMLDFILEHCGARILSKGIRMQRTVSDIADEVGRDTVLGKFLAALPPDVLFTQGKLNPYLPSGPQTHSYPEAIFAYLREMRCTSEALLGERDLL